MSLWKVNQITESTPGVGVNVTNARFRSGPWFDVTHSDFGAKGDGTTDDTAAIQAAINAAAVSGGTVFIPPSAFIASTLSGAANVRIAGVSQYKSIIRQKAGTTGDLLTFDNVANWEVCDLTLDGNSAGQSVANHGLRFKNFTGSVAKPLVRNLYVTSAKGDGIHLDASQNCAGMFANITVYACDGIGIHAGGYDNKWVSIDIGQSGLQGLYIAASNNHFTSVKSWFSGRITPASGHGIEHASGTGNTFMANIEAQDNQALGFLLHGSSLQGYGLHANSNNQGNLGRSGFGLISLSNSYIDGSANAVADLSTLQLYAVRFDSPVTNCVIRIRSANNVSGLVSGDPTGNDVEILDAAGTVYSHRNPINIYGSATSQHLTLVDSTDGNVYVKVYAFKGASGETNYRIDPTTTDNTKQALVDVFRSTNAVSAELRVFKGDGTATINWKVNNSGLQTFGAGPTFSAGSGSPETVVTAPIGSLYLRSNGGAGTCLYVKESGAGNTGWIAK